MHPEPTRCLLVVGKDAALRRMAGAVAPRAGWWVMAAPDLRAAHTLLQGGEVEGGVSALLFDLPASQAGGISRLEEIRRLHPRLPILVQSDNVSMAVQALRGGANDYLVKPVSADRLLGALVAAGDRRKARSVLRPLSEKLAPALGIEEMVGSAPAFRAALAIAAKVARSRSPVLIEGEAGTGKELFARAIHGASPRARRPMAIVNCASIPPAHLDPLLFGYEKGAFAGAFDSSVGKVARADGSTLFLDHVEALPPAAQDKLLCAIRDNMIPREGGEGGRRIDVRFIVSTSPRVANGLSEELLQVLSGALCVLPPLRERATDIPALARHLLARACAQPGMRALSIGDDALAILMAYGWPGNVRQLHDAIFRAALRSEGDALTAADFPQIERECNFSRRADDYHTPGLSGASATAALSNGAGVTLYGRDGHMRRLEEIEADVIRLAIGHYRGQMTEVARRLGIGRSTLYRKLAELGINDAA
jgi:DNA-binding NtrC family response regulator